MVEDKLFTKPSSFAHEESRLVMSIATFTDFKKVLEKVFDTGATVILYEAGVGCGRLAYRRIAGRISGKEEILEAFMNLKSEENWGKMTFKLNLEYGKGYVIVKDSFESRFYGFSSTPTCHYIRGYLTGFLSEFFGRKVEVKEIRCVSMGHKNCIFEVE